MAPYYKAGSFGWAGGGKSGAVVDLWATSRFSGFPEQGAAPPDANPPDAGPVTTGSTDGNPGGYLVTNIPTVEDYYIRIQYGGVSYWGSVTAASIGGVGGFAPLNSPAFTGVPTAPTPVITSNDQTLATTAFVQEHTATAGAVTLLSSKTLATPTANFTFSGIPATYNHLRVLVVAQSTAAAESDNFCVQLNSDTTSNYDAQAVSGINATAGAAESDGFVEWVAAGGYDLAAASASAGAVGYLDLEIPCYAQTVFYTIGKWTSGYMDLAKSSTYTGTFHEHVMWRNTAAVSNVKIFPSTGPNFATGSSAYLYGIT